MFARIASGLLATCCVLLLALGTVDALLSAEAFWRTEAPGLPSELVQAKADLGAASEFSSAFFTESDTAVRPEALAGAALQGPLPSLDTGRPVEHDLITAVLGATKRLDEAAEFAAELVKPEGPGPKTNVSSKTLREWLDARAEVVTIEADLRKQLADRSVDCALVAEYGRSPVSDPNLLQELKRACEGNAGNVIVIVPKTERLVRDKAFQDLLSVFQRQNADNLVRGGVWLVDNNGNKARWPTSGAIDPANALHELDCLKALKLAVAVDEEMARGLATPPKTLLIWRNDYPPESDRVDYLGRVTVPEDRKDHVILFWAREAEEHSKKLAAWFHLVNEYQVTPAELTQLASRLSAEARPNER